MSLMSEFKEFASKGNVVDMAVGMIVGAAFTSIVSSLVNDIIMPVIGKITGGINYSEWYLALDGNTYASLEEAKAATSVLSYGTFISAVINFLIVSFVLFMVIRSINKLKKPAPVVEAAPTTKICPFCKSEIPIDATRCPHCTSNLE